MLDAFFIALVAFAVLRATRTTLADGFPLAAALLVLLPAQLHIPLPGALPELTVHRVILGVLLLRWLREPPAPSGVERIHLSALLGCLLGARVVSTLLSVSPVASLKDLLGFALETLLFFALARRALVSPAIRLATFRALALALLWVAGIAFVERYTGLSLPRALVTDFHYCFDGIQSTFPHRILLGYALAMGLPPALVLLDTARTRAGRFGGWLLVLALLAACFLADTRGGWLGMVLAGGTSFVLGTRATRRRCLVLVALAAAALLLRPGIRQTIVSRINDTFAATSYRGVSYQYRWRLWHVAWSEIAASPERLLFGYGGLSTEAMDLSRYFRDQEGGTAAKIGYTSWDNHYASNLIEFGLVGLGLELLTYLVIVWQFARHARRAPSESRALLHAALATSLVFLFALTNVFVFSAQLKFLFWTIVAVGVTSARPVPLETAATPESTPPLPRLAVVRP